MTIPRSIPEIHENDYGTAFSFRVLKSNLKPFDLSSALVIIAFMRPDGSVFSREATLLSSDDSLLPPGSDGRAAYISIEGDIDQAGDWYAQLFAYFGNKTFGSTVVHFPVFPSLLSISEILAP